MLKQRFTVKQVAQKTGLEESEIRFYENVFSKHLHFTKMEAGSRKLSEVIEGLLWQWLQERKQNLLAGTIKPKPNVDADVDTLEE